MEMTIPQVSEVLARAARDEEFRKQLENDPVETLRAAGIPMIQRYDIDYGALTAQAPAEAAAEGPSGFKLTNHGWMFYLTAEAAANLKPDEIDPYISQAFDQVPWWQKPILSPFLLSLAAGMLAGILVWRAEGKKCNKYVRSLLVLGFWSVPGCGPKP